MSCPRMKLLSWIGAALWLLTLLPHSAMGLEADEVLCMVVNQKGENTLSQRTDVMANGGFYSFWLECLVPNCDLTTSILCEGSTSLESPPMGPWQ